MKLGAKKTQTVLAGGHDSRFAPNFIQNLYTVLKKRLWESRSTPILETRLKILPVLTRELFENLWPGGPRFRWT
jgi:hypothetical protein